MGATPAVSIVMPVYNAARYLPEALKSMLDQTFRDFELIAINDGSKDESLDILEQFAEYDSRIHIVSRPNVGITRTLNEGLSIARAPLIARMDADDISRNER